MTSKKPKQAIQVLLGTLFLVFIAAACNNSSDKKASDKDTTTTDTSAIKHKPTDSGN